MSDFKMRTPEENQDIVLAVLSSINFDDYRSRADLEFDIAKKTSRILSHISDGSVAPRIAGAIRIYCEIKAIEFEESSQRYVITFRAANAREDDSDEKIRTDRLDSRNGELVKKMLCAGEEDKLVGKKAFIYKTNEPNPKKKGQTIRVCPFVDVFI